MFNLKFDKVGDYTNGKQQQPDATSKSKSSSYQTTKYANNSDSGRFETYNSVFSQGQQLEARLETPKDNSSSIYTNNHVFN